jgi:hypothetical protein
MALVLDRLKGKTQYYLHRVGPVGTANRQPWVVSGSGAGTDNAGWLVPGRGRVTLLRLLAFSMSVQAVSVSRVAMAFPFVGFVVSV